MIKVENLTKIYNGTTKAVDNISFETKPGKIYGFLGPNGAGKTTTMNIITGYIGATSGNITVNGYDIYNEPKKAKQCIGYLPEHPPLYLDLTPYEYLNIAAGLKGIPKQDRVEQIEEVMRLTGIKDVSRRLVKQLSKGYRQRVGLASAILGFPPIIILDEPTVGLDPRQIIEIRDLILRLKENHTIILSSHILAEVSAICDIIMIISNGRLIANDTAENLSDFVSESNTVTLSVKGSREQIEQVLEDACPDCELTFFATHEEEIVDIKVDGEGSDLREKVFFALANEHLPILAMSKANLTLEEVFLKYIELDASENEYTEDTAFEEEVDEDELLETEESEQKSFQSDEEEESQ